VQTFERETESYGSNVILTERFIVIGSPDSTPGTVSSFVDQSDSPGASWTAVPDVTGDSGFGTDVGLVQLGQKNNNDVLMFVGSPQSSSGQGNVLLYRYQPSGNIWVIQDDEDSTLAGAGASGEAFGSTVAVSSTRLLIVVGAPEFQAGRVFTFFLANGDQPNEYTAAPLLTDPLLGSALDARFGAALDITIDGNFMAVGEPGQSSFAIFSWDGGDWDKVFSFTLPQAVDFGTSVTFLSSDSVAVGGPSSNNGRGEVRVFQLGNGGWVPLKELLGGTDGDRLGDTNSLSGSLSAEGVVGLVVGTSNGSIERYDFIEGEWLLRASVDTGSAVSAVDSFDYPESNQYAVLAGLQSTQSVVLYDNIERNSPLSTANPSSTPWTTPSGETPTGQPSLAPTTQTAPSAGPTPLVTQPPTTPRQWGAVAGPFSTSESFNADFGFAVALVDDFLLAGEPLGGNLAEGNVVAFSRLGGYSTVPFDFSLATIQFGYALDAAVVSGTPSVVVGAINTNFENPTSNTFERFGSAHYFEFDGQDWVEVGETIEPDVVLQETGAEFGQAVALSSASRRIAIAAPSSSVSAQLKDTGRIYTFEFNGSNWVEMAGALVGARAGMFLGSSLDMSTDGTMLLAGSPGDGGGDGSAALYEWTGSFWNQTFFLQAESDSQESLGTSVAFVSSSIIAVGGPNHASGQGVIRIYENSDGNGFQKVTDIVGEAGESLGNTISGSNSRVAYGTETGSFHVFGHDGQAFFEMPSTGGPSSLGSAVQAIALSVDGTTVAVGTASEEVVVYELS